ncbi:LuxR family transcriptional regulator, partial [Mycobacterium sp. ITM-2017-0098]
AAARSLRTFDDYSSCESYLEAIAALMYGGRFADPVALREAAEAALPVVAEAAASRAVRPVDLLLKGTAERIIGGYGAGAATLRTALKGMCDQADSDDVAVGRWLRVPGFPILQESAGHELWDATAIRHLSTSAV